MDKHLHPRQMGGFSRSFRNFLLIRIFRFRIFILQRAKTHKQNKSYTRDALLDKNSHPRQIRGISIPFRNFLLIHIFKFQIFILPRTKTHKQHKSYTRDALMDKNSNPRWMGNFSRPFRNWKIRISRKFLKGQLKPPSISGVNFCPLRHLGCNFCAVDQSWPLAI